MSALNLNKEQYENVFRNIKKELPNTISGELEKMEQIMKNEYTEFIHKAFIFKMQIYQKCSNIQLRMFNFIYKNVQIFL